MYNVIVLGITGAGKSQLCNFLFEDIENCRYKVGNELYSCTYMKDIIEAEKQGKTILNGKFNLIDSPGGDDSKGKDLENLEELIKYLQKKGRIDCILLVLNYRNKISNSIEEYLKKLSHLFTPSEFYNHLIIIFSNYPKESNSKDKKKIEIYIEQINYYMKKIFEITDKFAKLPIYFVDTDACENNDKKYFSEKQKIIRKNILERIGLISENNNFQPIFLNEFSSYITAENKRYNNNEYFYYKIRGSDDGIIWGETIFTDDSNIAKAAVFMGICNINEEKIVKIRILEGRSYYPNSYKNGIKSNSWGSWPGSYIFV